MAKIVVIGLEQVDAGQLSCALAADGHQIAQQPQNVVTEDLLDADIVFAGGEPDYYISPLRRVRDARPSLPFVVVTRIPETRKWPMHLKPARQTTAQHRSIRVNFTG